MSNADLISRLHSLAGIVSQAFIDDVVAALEAAQPEGKPVAWVLWNTRDEEAVMLYTGSKPTNDFKDHLELRPVCFTGYMPAPAPQVPMTLEEIEAAFGKRYPHDLPLIKLAENNRDFALDSIGARHHFAAFKAAITAAEAHHGVKP